jgi:hypothetical protein
MKKRKLRRPSPALVVSMVALFVALGGSAYAATKIGTKQIKNGAVTAAKLRKEAVTAAKIKNGSIGGAKLDLAHLGTVPSAAHAATADKAAEAAKAQEAVKAAEAGKADEAKTANLATNFSRYTATGVVRASVGQEVTLWQAGPFTATGLCENKGGGEFQALTELTTSAPKSVMAAEDDERPGFDFEPGETIPIGDFVVGKEAFASESDGPTEFTAFEAISPDGRSVLVGNAINIVHALGADCAFVDEYTNAA